MSKKKDIPRFMQSKEDKVADVEYFLWKIRYNHLKKDGRRDMRTGRLVQIVAKTLEDAKHWIEYRNTAKIFIEEYGMIGEIHTITGQIQDEITRSNAKRVAEFDELKKKELEAKLKRGALPRFVEDAKRGHTFKK